MMALMSRLVASVIVLILPIPFVPRFAGPLTLFAPHAEFHTRHDAMPGTHRLEPDDARIDAGLLDRVRNRRFAGDDDIIANLDMARDAHVAADHAACPDAGTAGHAGTPGNRR